MLPTIMIKSAYKQHKNVKSVILPTPHVAFSSGNDSLFTFADEAMKPPCLLLLVL